MTDVSAVRERLLDWYDRHGRSLPWRVRPEARAAGLRPDPYRVWLSEVMLQQTTTAHAAPYFDAFTRRWPVVAALADAQDGEVMAAWAGLGYYARARNLLACARAVTYQHGGIFPSSEEALRTLPGIGAYTAAAVAAIAFDRPANVVDGNVERVMSRLHGVETPLPDAKPALAGLAARYVEDHRPGDWAQALMDLGATVCTPKSPRCLVCPLAPECLARRRRAPETYPRKTAKADRPHRYGVAYVAWRGEQVALVRRPPRGLLGGMLGLPTSAWTATAPPTPEGWTDAGVIEHVFTHFTLTLHVVVSDASHPQDAEWTPAAEARAVLPTVFRKALDRALGYEGRDPETSMPQS
jgi:A/G-specific adenine glycosylase